MATFTSPGINKIPTAGVSGNACVEVGTITGNGAGAAAAAASVLRLIKLPAQTRINDLTIYMSAATTNLTISAGIEPVDGTTADPDAFIAASTAAATAIGVRANAGATMPLTLTKECYLTVTTAVAELALDTTVKMVVHYENLGQK